ncbi:hybrid sensor histidine kinase/response regulator [Inhella gelatinilytica]|uniref:Response regulator n=1 Tax=Inhella gelatinilytica TaxID=2795030 RepID=A0A931IW96_9BURK|nr:response regulator [Inhella gelatinilytica]MBH9552731.1 response regulator [Inhella gelatinilytica]
MQGIPDTAEGLGAQPGLTVLHVEDSELDHLMIQALVRQSGVAVHWTRVETRDAFEQALTQPWDAVVCDYQLPDTSGLELLQRLRAQDQVLPFILVSGEIGEEVAVAAMKEGASDYLLKGHLARLGVALQQAVRAAHAERSRRAADQALRKSTRQLQELTAHLQQRIEAERAALARELHDDVGSALTALKFELAGIQRHAADDAQRRRSQRAIETLTMAMEASRRLMADLRPPILQEGVVAALQWLVQDFERRHAIAIQCEGLVDDPTVGSELSLVIYRFVQEALHNVAKHAQATQVRVELHQSSGVLGVEVHDNGRGMEADAADRPGHFGLRGLQERAASVGGWVDLSSRPGHGVQLVLSIPRDGNWELRGSEDAAWWAEDGA